MLENQPACWDSGFYFSLLFLPDEKVQQLVGQMGAIDFLWRLPRFFFFFFSTVGLFISGRSPEFNIFAADAQRWFALPMIPRVQEDEHRARPAVIDVILGSSRRGRSTPGDILVTGRFMGGSAPARVLPDVDNSSHCGSLEPLTLRHICHHPTDRFKELFCSESCW